MMHANDADGMVKSVDTDLGLHCLSVCLSYRSLFLHYCKTAVLYKYQKGLKVQTLSGTALY